MKKSFLFCSSLIGIPVIFLALWHCSMSPEVAFSIMNGSMKEWAMIDNGLSILLMLSAFYMIGKNFMFQKQMDQFKDKFRVLINNIKLF